MRTEFNDGIKLFVDILNHFGKGLEIKRELSEEAGFIVNIAELEEGLYITANAMSEQFAHLLECGVPLTHLIELINSAKLILPNGEPWDATTEIISIEEIIQEELCNAIKQLGCKPIGVPTFGLGVVLGCVIENDINILKIHRVMWQDYWKCESPFSSLINIE